jgi:hypothetical protein
MKWKASPSLSGILDSSIIKGSFLANELCSLRITSLFPIACPLSLNYNPIENERKLLSSCPMSISF